MKSTRGNRKDGKKIERNRKERLKGSLDVSKNK
jgi:hypothetical protein